MTIKVKYHKQKPLDLLRKQEVITGETFSEVLEELCNNLVIDPQFGILTDSKSFSSLVYCAFVPHPIMDKNIIFQSKREIRALFDNLFKSVTIENDLYRPMFRIDKIPETKQLSNCFLVNALYYIDEKNIDEIKRCFEKSSDCSESRESKWYFFD